MDHSEATKVLFQRIQKLEPENASKIIGYLLLKNCNELEMIELAHGPDYVLQTLADNLKVELGLPSKPTISCQSSTSNNSIKLTPSSLLSSSSSTTFSNANSRLVPQVSTTQRLKQDIHNSLIPYWDQVGGYDLEKQTHLSSYGQVGYNSTGLNVNAQSYVPKFKKNQTIDQQSKKAKEICLQHPELSIPSCDDYKKGYCEHGSDCKFLHLLKLENGFMVVNRSNEFADDAILPSDGYPKQLEKEFVELLKVRRAIPIPLSSLPILYEDKYAKLLPVEDCSPEPHKIGRICCGLTKLLAQMTSCIRVIDKPNGVPTMILEDDYMRYMSFIEERTKHSSNFAIQCQVYLTFPLQCELREQDIQNYFEVFGLVREVRIPSQGKGMYGFVTFVYPETASLVLSKSNPHYICEAQVMAKPYKPKQRIENRKIHEKDKRYQDHHNDLRFLDMQAKPTLVPKLEVKHISKMETTNSIRQSHALVNQTCGCFNLFKGGVPSNAFPAEAEVNVTDDHNKEKESCDQLNLPDNPFSFDGTCDFASFKSLKTFIRRYKRKTRETKIITMIYAF